MRQDIWSSWFFTFWKLVAGATRIKLPNTGRVVHLRKKSWADRFTFEEVFLDRHYQLDAFINTKNIKVILDAGANIGYASVFFAESCPHATYYILEPSPDNLALLKQNVVSISDAHVIESALWRNDGYIEIVDAGYGVRGYMVKEADSGIPCLSMKSLISENNLDVIDVLKMDVEGSEKEILESEDGWLNQVKVLFIETHDRMKEGTSAALFNAISKYNFDMEVSGENLVFVNRKFGGIKNPDS